MGLITKEVEIIITNRNKKYYKEKGYCIFEKNKSIVVKTEDLPKWSEIEIELECDKCHKDLNVKYNSYVRHNHNGKTYCKDCGRKLFQTKENHWKWNPNKTDEERLKNRDIYENKVFTQKVMSRDNYTCQCCGQQHKDIQVHHLDSWDWCIERRFDETNGITLCDNCHKNFHHIYGYGNNTKHQFEEWIGYTVGQLEQYKGTLPVCRKIIDMDTFTVLKSGNEAANLIGSSPSYIYQCCNQKIKHCKGKHFLWFDEYTKMSKEDLIQYWESVYDSQVICLETLHIYQDATKASRLFGVKYGIGIARCCNGNQKYSGKLSDGTKLHWMYYKDYLRLSDDEKIKLENKYKIKNIESEVA